MIITGCNETSEKSPKGSSSETSELNRTFISMRNNLREDLKGIQCIKW